MENEKRLIDANALVPYLWALFKFFGSIPCTEADKATQRGIKRCIGEIKKMPTVDAVEVVRCKDCQKWYRHTEVDRERGECRRYQTTKHETGYCDRGERKDNE